MPHVRRAALIRLLRSALAVLLLAVTATLIVCASSRLPPLWGPPLWAGFVVIIAGMLARWLPQVLGPLFGYDLIRTARRGQYAIHRCFYAVLLAALIGFLFYTSFPDRFLMGRVSGPPNYVEGVAELAAFAKTCFMSFLTMQFIVILLITPLYTADAITRERELRTLPLLLTTPLTRREIILGILGARLANLILLILTGLPVLSLLEFLGGIEPLVIIAGFLLAILTLLSLASVSILVSVNGKSSIDAVVVSYFGSGFFVLLSCAQSAALMVGPSTAHAWELVGFFVVIHLIVTCTCCQLAVDRLHGQAEDPTAPAIRRLERVAVLSEAAEKVRVANPVSLESDRHEFLRQDHPRPRRTRPPVSDHALWWKEVHAERRVVAFQFGEDPSSSVALIILVPIFFATLLMTVGYRDESTAETLQVLARLFCGLASAILILSIALDAAGRMSRERQKCTLEALLTLPVERREILAAKWLGSVVCVRRSLWLPLVLVLIGVVAGGIHPLSLPFLAVATFIGASLAASIGLWFSTFCRSSLRAHLLTVLVVSTFLVGPANLITVFYPSVRIPPAPLTSLEGIGHLLGPVLNPPSIFRNFTFRTADLNTGIVFWWPLIASTLGLLMYLLLSLLLYLCACRRLERERGPAVRSKRLRRGSVA